MLFQFCFLQNYDFLYNWSTCDTQSFSDLHICFAFLLRFPSCFSICLKRRHGLKAEPVRGIVRAPCLLSNIISSSELQQPLMALGPGDIHLIHLSPCMAHTLESWAKNGSCPNSTSCWRLGDIAGRFTIFLSGSESFLTLNSFNNNSYILACFP